MERFLSILTSEKGPITQFDEKLFQEILAFFSAELQDHQKVSNKQQPQQQCYQTEDNFRTKESLEDILHWDDSLPASNDVNIDNAKEHDPENLIPSKRAKSKLIKKIKSTVIRKETNITGTLKIPYMYLVKLEFRFLFYI